MISSSVKKRIYEYGYVYEEDNSILTWDRAQ